jgi:N-acetylglucosaminyl-diphospho-decaprenol L-rhamnosyltransferase
MNNVTLVVITRNRSTRLLETLEELQRHGASIIVVDNGSTDHTEARVSERFPAVRILRFSVNRGAWARTAAVELASTEFVAFSDDDSWWAPGALERGVDALLADPRVGLVAARVLVGREMRLDPASAVMRDSPLATDPPLQGPRVLGFVACAAICRRDGYLATGGFHPRYGIGGEEALIALDLAQRGLACTYLESVVAHHHPVHERSDRRERQRTTARNDLWTAWLRLPLRQALACTAAIPRRPEGVRGLLRAVRGAVWVTRQRQRVSPSLARDVRLLGLR